MDNLADKIKELEKPLEQYRIKREAAQKEAEEKQLQYKVEMDACILKIIEVERTLSGIEFEIEDTEPFFRYSREEHPEMGKRWVLVKKANKDELFARIYSGDISSNVIEEKRPTECTFDIIKALCDRLPGFLEVVKIKIDNVLK